MDEWQELNSQQWGHVTKALANPVRCAIYDRLRESPMRQSVLAQYISRKFGTKFSSALLRHHLHLLEDAGLIDFEVNPRGSKRVKMVYRKADMRVQLRSQQKPTVLEEATKTEEEFVAELKNAFKKS